MRRGGQQQRRTPLTSRVRPKTARRATKTRKRLPTLSSLKKQLWRLCRAYIRQRDKGVCQACGATGLEGGNAQTSHLIASSICGAYLRYDPRNLYLCCYRCNVSLSGNIANLYRNIERKHGKAFMEQLWADKQLITQLDRQFLLGKIDQYEDLLRDKDEIQRFIAEAQPVEFAA